MKFTEQKIEDLKIRIIKSISDQGFYVNGKISPIANGKSDIKKLHSHSKHQQLLNYRKFLQQNFSTIKGNTISGAYLKPDKIDLELVEVRPNTKEEILYRWWNLVWWSMPYQPAYGRQMRFLIWDKYHNSPFGLIGLQSPVLKMAVRDDYLNIPKGELDIWVNRSMQAQRVGALPPYNDLIGGKMVALSLGSNELRKAYKLKYENKTTLLENRTIDSDLLFITTSSAYGRSSIYNRLKFKNETIGIKLGTTKGFGTFHIPDSLFKEIKEFLNYEGVNTETTFGNGPSKKIKLLYQAFSKLDLPNYSQHKILREYYLFPHVHNLEKVISEGENPDYIDRPFNDLFHYWKKRWCMPRSVRQNDWKQFDMQSILKTSLKDII